MNLVKRGKWLAGAVVVILLGLGAAPLWGQTSETITTTTTTVTTTVNPNDPLQFPPGVLGDSHEGKVKAAFVDEQIAEAKARGQDTSAAETQEIMGQAALRRGLNNAAAQHFDTALRAVGVMPNSPGEDSGESEGMNSPMP